MLAEAAGVGDEVAAWTSKAMDGNVLFQDALSERLSIIKPSRALLEKISESNATKLSPGVETFVSNLHDRGIHVCLISGGFRSMIDPVAASLGIRNDHVFANSIYFDDTGEYQGFDENEFTSRQGGKCEAIAHIRQVFGYRTVIMIGDGVTDMEACPPADAFIGFGGVKIRSRVKEGADWFVTSFDQLISVFEAHH